MSRWTYIALIAIPLFFAWDITRVSPGIPGLNSAALIASGLAVVGVIALIEINRTLGRLSEQSIGPTARDFYAVEVFTVSTEGRELIEGDKTVGFHVDHFAKRKLERVVTGELGDADFHIGWAKKEGPECASQETLVFDDYAVATACAQEFAESLFYPNLAREVSLKVVSAEDRRRAGNTPTWSRRWPSKFREIELMSS